MHQNHWRHFHTTRLISLLHLSPLANSKANMHQNHCRHFHTTRLISVSTGEFPGKYASKSLAPFPHHPPDQFAPFVSTGELHGKYSSKSLSPFPHHPPDQCLHWRIPRQICIKITGAISTPPA